MFLEDLFLWVSRDSTRRNKDEEGTIIAKRLEELAAFEEAQQTRAIPATFPNPSARRKR